MKPLRIVTYWAGVSGYMAACWRELARRPDVRHKLISFAPPSHTPFDPALLQGVDAELLNRDADFYPSVERIALEHQPDLLVVSGWIKSLQNHRLATHPRLRNTPVVMTMDTPFQGTLRQRVGGLALRRYLARIDHVWVTGERSRTLARVLGIPEQRITLGTYGVDTDAFAEALQRRAAGSWPRAFLFTARYDAQTKGLDVLVKAYQRYRAMRPDPWPLTCCGKGPDQALLKGRPGIEDLGFVQPSQQPELYARHGAFVLPSRYDPWPLAIVEACAAGLPVLCTTACGSAVECVRDLHTGRIVPADDVESLAEALAWLHDRHADLPAMGQAARNFALPYSAQRWADRLLHIAHAITADR